MTGVVSINYYSLCHPPPQYAVASASLYKGATCRKRTNGECDKAYLAHF